MSPRKNERELFESSPILLSIIRLAVPTVLGQIILVIYNMADTFFIGLTGSDAMLTAATVCMPAFMFLSAISNLFGVGGASVISRAMGQGDAGVKQKELLSMGADHTAICFLRRPDLFAGMLALSGVYDADYFFDGFMNPTLYENSPERFLPNMPADHPYIGLYNRKKIIFCVGQGAWEEDGVRTLRFLQSVFEQKGIHAWCDFWGYDVNHDWPWWFRQLRYFLPFLLNEQ